MERSVPEKHNPCDANHAPTSTSARATAYEMLCLIEDDKEKVVRRFMSFVSCTPFGCWEWQGARDAKGYGVFSFMSHPLRSHRASYLLWKGRVSRGFEIDHICNNRACVNPDHLQVVTPYQNKVLGKIRRARATHCPQGHELSEENLVSWRLKADGFRSCLLCQRKRDRERQSLQRQRNKARKQNYNAS